MWTDGERCVRAVLSNDRRFDGQFVVAVATTRIYCRPSCPVAPPRIENMRFLPTVAAAQAAGFRACKRCLPDAAPGSPDWDIRADLVARAVRLIADGVVDRHGVSGLASRLARSRRQLERQMAAELGAGPLALARAQRAHTAGALLEATRLSMAEIAFASGFGSVRQFNDTVRSVFAMTPGELRRRSRGEVSSSAGTVTVRLPFRPPLAHDALLGQLAASAVPGVEEWRDGAYRRTLRLPRGTGIVALSFGPGHVRCQLTISELQDLPAAIARCRRLLDLDADPFAIDEVLAADPALAPLVARCPGRRTPRGVDEEETALRVVLAGQSSDAVARRRAAGLVAVAGVPVADRGGGLTHLFPSAAEVAAADLTRLRLPEATRAAVQALACALARGELDLGTGADRSAARSLLAAVPGLDPGTVETIAERALGDPDAFTATGRRVRLGAGRLGLPDRPTQLARRAERWRPWRAYAARHLEGAASPTRG
jgi:AraC family transcriptional regulator of adaptative response / DNA-3-methyladenine glycosylase II